MKLTELTIGFSVISALCGFLAILLLYCIHWYISGVSMDLWLIAALPFVILWFFAGIISWKLVKSSKKLPIITFLIAIVGIVVGGIILTLSSDASIKGWIFLFSIGSLICSVPAYILLQLIASPLLSHMIKYVEKIHKNT